MFRCNMVQLRLSKECLLLFLPMLLLVVGLMYLAPTSEWCRLGVVNEKCYQTVDRGAPLRLSQQLKRANYAAQLVSLKRLVVVTAFRANHYITGLSMLGTVQQFLPAGTTVIVYDLGLNVAQRASLKTICNVELRSFDFYSYPPHFRQLVRFGLWKPVIMKEIVKETNLMLFMDPSARLKKPLNETILHHLSVFPIQALHWQSRAVQYTHDDTLTYLGVRREQMRGFTTVLTTCLFMKVTRDSLRLLNLWTQCIVKKSCVYPEGVITGVKKRQFCSKSQLSLVSVEYGGCHHFTQSAFNVALVRLFGKSVFSKIVPGCTRKRYGKGPLNQIEQHCDWMDFFEIQVSAVKSPPKLLKCRKH